MNLKTQLRAKIKLKTAKTTLEQKKGLVKNILSVLSGHEFDKIGFYYAIGLEPRIEDILMLLKDKTFALPKMVDGELAFYKYVLCDNLGASKLGVLEPLNNDMIIPDVILIPGLAFDASGYRLGHGLGIYDRYLVHSSLVKIGVCFNDSLVNVLPVQAHDIKMDYVVTENLILKIC